MVRTKADNSARKAVAAKAPRKALAPTRAASVMSPSGGKKNKYDGGNPVNPQPTPEWQKSISSFFTVTSSSSSGKENKDPEDGPCSSKDVDRTEEKAGGSSSSQEQISALEQMEEEEREKEEESEEEEEEEEKPAPSRHFKRNKCISDSEDDDE